MKHLKRFATGLAVAAVIGGLFGFVICFRWFVENWPRVFAVLAAVYLIYGAGYLARMIKFNYGDEA